MKIFYTQESVHDLKRLRNFIAKDSPKAAAEISSRLLQAVRRLVDFPLIGKQINSISEASVIRDLITGKYVIRYLVLNTEIHILRVWHGKEDRPIP